MFDLWLPALFAIFIWWFSTGLILLLDSMPRTTFRWSLVISSVLAVAALLGLNRSAQLDTVAGTYCGFSCALLVWGWHELSFLTGWITGPRKEASPPGTIGWMRFVHAVQAIAWHELAIAAVGVTIIWMTWDAPNQVGTWTFVVLWTMRISAKLNLFFGVRNLSEEFLPPHLTYMQSFFRRRPMNALFPLSVTVATVVATQMVSAALAPPSPTVGSTGLMLASTLLVMAILEHWLLVLPLPATALWRWAMRPAEPAARLPADPLSLDTDDKLFHAR